MTERSGRAGAGGGVCGPACARGLARRGAGTGIPEAIAALGRETSARNREWCHAGLYYPAGSLKARLCVAGKALLYDFCATHHVAHRRCGKLLVATTAEPEEALAALRRKAEANGVADLPPLTGPHAQALAPR